VQSEGGDLFFMPLHPKPSQTGFICWNFISFNIINLIMFLQKAQKRTKKTMHANYSWEKLFLAGLVCKAKKVLRLRITHTHKSINKITDKIFVYRK